MNLQKKADKAFQEWGRRKYKNCLFCTTRPYSCLHHFHTKGASSALRYDEENGIPVCYYHHCSFHSKRAAEITSQLIDMRGLEWSNRLLVKKRNIVKTTKKYYETIIKYYAEKDNG